MNRELAAETVEDIYFKHEAKALKYNLDLVEGTITLVHQFLSCELLLKESDSELGSVMFHQAVLDILQYNHPFTDLGSYNDTYEKEAVTTFNNICRSEDFSMQVWELSLFFTAVSQQLLRNLPILTQYLFEMSDEQYDSYNQENELGLVIETASNLHTEYSKKNQSEFAYLRGMLHVAKSLDVWSLNNGLLEFSDSFKVNRGKHQDI
jgi:hypothetical protein